ncbi:MAG: formylglycine-generating enzyme family protein [Planctomycetota bacterium]|nr:formylglycine-generating enzyme family protein [Planctomycetota bacterium]
MKRAALLALLVLAPNCGGPDSAPPREAPTGMVWIPPGEFDMGSNDGLADERPVHRVRLSGFFLDVHEVTNAQFRAFVDATGYVTTAERAPTVEEILAQSPPGTPPPPPEVLVPGALVLDATMANGWWWKWMPGASWRKPDGEHALTSEHDNHPVVQVSWDDAQAYAKWAKRRLPTEAEWERAARGGVERQRYVWGTERNPQGKELANIWQGRFPEKNTVADGFEGTAPIGSFPANGFGLSDMAGNVWEWTADWYRPDAYSKTPADALDPKGPTDSFDPQEPGVAKRVTRGGSFLCSDNYCIGYRPSARMKSSPDTGLFHTGFRCALDP